MSAVCLLLTITRLPFAGRDVTDYLHLLLRKAGYQFNTTAEREIVRLIKEKVCYVALQPSKEEKELRETGAAKTSEDFLLPDGNVIKLGEERYKAPEILFSPDLGGFEEPGIHQMLADSIAKTDLDLRRTLFSNVVLSGGTTLCRGFGDRLVGEMRKVAPPDVKIKIYAPPERKYSTWMGGSILASLSTFKKMWVSADEYQENPVSWEVEGGSGGKLY